jgi:hypothetical protein
VNIVKKDDTIKQKGFCSYTKQSTFRMLFDLLPNTKLPAGSMLGVVIKAGGQLIHVNPDFIIFDSIGTGEGYEYVEFKALKPTELGSDDEM